MISSLSVQLVVLITYLIQFKITLYHNLNYLFQFYNIISIFKKYLCNSFSKIKINKNKNRKRTTFFILSSSRTTKRIIYCIHVKVDQIH